MPYRIRWHKNKSVATDPARDHSKPLPPFAIRNLSVLAYANGFTLWHYKSPEDSMSTITASGYFNDAADMISAGDMLLIVSKGSAGVRAVSITGNGNVTLVEMA